MNAYERYLEWMRNSGYINKTSLKEKGCGKEYMRHNVLSICGDISFANTILLCDTCAVQEASP